MQSIAKAQSYAQEINSNEIQEYQLCRMLVQNPINFPSPVH